MVLFLEVDSGSVRFRISSTLAGRGDVRVRCAGWACENRCNADLEYFKFSGSGSIPEDINDFFSVVSFLIRLVGLVLFFVQVRQTSFPIRQAPYITKVP